MTFQGFSLEGKTALVTGAGRGLGLEAARAGPVAGQTYGHWTLGGTARNLGGDRISGFSGCILCHGTCLSR